MYYISRTRNFAENVELTSPLFGPYTLLPSSGGRDCGKRAVDLDSWFRVRRKHLQSAKRGRMKSYYALYRLLCRVHIFAVLNPATLEFGPRALAACCERRALGGAWWLVFGCLGHAVKPCRRGQLRPGRISVVLFQATGVA